jgi:hypothetical protein
MSVIRPGNATVVEADLGEVLVARWGISAAPVVEA